MAVFLAKMVMPRSRSRSLESITRSATTSLARKAPLWRSMAATSVVLPWSTCAMIAILRIREFKSVSGSALLKNGVLLFYLEFWLDAEQAHWGKNKTDGA